MDANETRWLADVEDLLGLTGGLDDETKRLLLRLTKVTAEVTGIRYLAPLTSYVVGRAAGRAEAAGERFDVRAAADAINALAGEWGPPRSG
jgi:hypothetical protein